MKRTERVGAIIKILTDSPCKVFPLQFFCDLFNTAKSSVSEDISIASSSVMSTGTGYIETIAGAKGGVRFVPDISDEELIKLQNELCDKLRDHSRILAGDFLYTSDIFFGLRCRLCSNCRNQGYSPSCKHSKKAKYTTCCNSTRSKSFRRINCKH